MTQTLNVEYEELMARADEIEQPLPPIPSTNPAGPCELSFVKDAATQLALNADSIRLYLKACEREWRNLAKSLRNAAKAYEEVDEQSADAMNSEMSGSGATSTSAGGSDQASMLCDPEDVWYPPPPPPAPPPFQYPYYEVRQAATDIETGDHGTAFRAFARDWDAFQRALQRETYRFRPFVSWEGEARILVETNFDQHRQWIYSMAALCSQIASQANTVVDAHKKASATTGYQNQHAVDGAHPTSYEVSQCDYWYKWYSTNSQYQWYVQFAIEWYEKLQAKSEEVLGQYVSNAQLPMRPVTPQRVPSATRIDAPKPSDPNGPNNPSNPADPNNPYDPSIPVDPNNPANPSNPIDPGSPLGEGDLSTNTPTVPSVPSAPTPATPPMPDTAKLDQALKDLKGTGGLPGGAGLKPASLGGGGAAGMPSVPLQPAAEAGASAGPAAAAAGTGAATGRGMPGMPGATGGGMGGGMAPMGAGQGKQDAGKGKRVQSEDESLYTEERQWTEGVIGNRPRKGGPEK